MKNFLKEGDTVTVTAPANVTSGQAGRVGVMFGVYVRSALSGEKVGLKVTGVFQLPKATGAAWTEGQRLFWSVANSNVTGTAGGNLAIGVAESAAASGDTSGRVRLSGAWGANAQEA